MPKIVQNVKYEWNLQFEVLKPTFNLFFTILATR